MPEERYITIVSERKTIALRVSTILYVLMNGIYANIHVLGDQVYRTTMTLGEIEEKIGDGFLRVHRGCLVAVMAIHNVTDTINLSNGESLGYTARKKGEIMKTLRNAQQDVIRGFQNHGVPMTDDEYHGYYRSFDQLPFAFTDIEMVFDEEKRAVDWIFRYGNEALATLEKQPLDKMIGSSFSSLFSNMDAKWLHVYERATLYGETLEIMDYSPEIDTNLKIICFPTFLGHCGCILFNADKMKSISEENHLVRLVEVSMKSNSSK